MKVEINEETIKEILNEQATKAVINSLKSYKVATTISEVINEELAQGVMRKALNAAVSQMDITKLSEVLAKEIQRTTIAAVVTILQEGLLDIVCKIRGINNYSEEDKKEREKLKNKLFNGGKNE